MKRFILLTLSVCLCACSCLSFTTEARDASPPTAKVYTMDDQIIPAFTGIVPQKIYQVKSEFGAIETTNNPAAIVQAKLTCRTYSWRRIKRYTNKEIPISKGMRPCKFLYC